MRANFTEQKAYLLTSKPPALFARFFIFFVAKFSSRSGHYRQLHEEDEKRAMKIGSKLTLALFCIAVAPVAAKADDEQGKQACMTDAMTICAQFIPNRERVANCLMSKSRAHLGPLPRAARALA
jgi:hypothetical protein